MEVFLKAVCSGKCCKLSNSCTAVVVLLGFVADLGACQGKKKENVNSAAPDVHFHNLSRYEGILICGF